MMAVKRFARNASPAESDRTTVLLAPTDGLANSVTDSDFRKNEASEMLGDRFKLAAKVLKMDTILDVPAVAIRAALKPFR